MAGGQRGVHPARGIGGLWLMMLSHRVFQPICYGQCAGRCRVGLRASASLIAVESLQHVMVVSESPDSNIVQRLVKTAALRDFVATAIRAG
jgi:hypothetical protein